MEVKTVFMKNAPDRIRGYAIHRKDLYALKNWKLLPEIRTWDSFKGRKFRSWSLPLDEHAEILLSETVGADLYILSGKIGKERVCESHAIMADGKSTYRYLFDVDEPEDGPYGYRKLIGDWDYLREKLSKRDGRKK